LATAEEKHGEFERLRSVAADEFARTGRVVIPRKPHRPSVVASELGEMFLLEGELESARFFFEKAVNPLFPFPDRLPSVFSALGEKANS